MLKLDTIWQPEYQQQQFRRLLDAMSRPGKIYPLTDTADRDSGLLGVLASLLDTAVTFSDPQNIVLPENVRLLQAGLAGAEMADYIVCDGMQAPEFTPKLGNLASPEQSATIVLRVQQLGASKPIVDGIQLTLSGPGIEQQNMLEVKGLNETWLHCRQQWNSRFPLGVDFILIDPMQLVALPRTTRVEMS